MKIMFRKTTALLLAIIVLTAFTACGQGEGVQHTSTDLDDSSVSGSVPSTEGTETTKAEIADDDVDGELIMDHEEELQYAQFYTLTHYKGGYKSFTIIGGQEDYEWLIVPEGKSVPQNLADNVVVIQQPIDRIRCDSGTAAMVNAFGGLDKVATVNTDINGWEITAVKDKMQTGEISYSGSYKEPDYERITAEDIQLVIDTNMLDSCPEVKEKYEELGIPYFVIRNSRETHPLGHTEWAKLYGAVLGLWDEANTYYNAQAKKVADVSDNADTGVSVAVVYFSSDGTKVYARRGGDYMAAMVDLAGGEYIMAGFEPEETGVSTITMEEFYSLCMEADYLINLNMAAKLYTMDELLEYVPLMEDFKSVQNGNVYMARNRFSQFTYDNGSIIEDLNTILTDSTVEETTYFTKMK
ncbi:MAG: ABC transporter substrate-binding protein [Lachnospiraceae bacterium]|nr:ABC transporter substrate-binding protein [Lachnospiraceae bacterium]